MIVVARVRNKYRINHDHDTGAVGARRPGLAGPE
jgi:hypothetical protein